MKTLLVFLFFALGVGLSVSVQAQTSAVTQHSDSLLVLGNTAAADEMFLFKHNAESNPVAKTPQSSSISNDFNAQRHPFRSNPDNIPVSLVESRIEKSIMLAKIQ